MISLDRDSFLKSARGALTGSTNGEVTRDQIRETVFALAKTFTITDADAGWEQGVCRSLEATLVVRMGGHSEVVDRATHTPWLSATAAEREPYYWTRYRAYLEEAIGLPGTVVSRLNEVTDNTLDLLQNPAESGNWSRRGMVVGHVQSGKTANYTGLICKAADAGYRLVVVIAGIHNNLRTQTQQRIEEGFIGRQSGMQGSEALVGVGRLDRNETKFPISLTNRGKDFNKEFASQLGLKLEQVNEPMVLVIKKNPHTLRRLIDWLAAHNAAGGGSSLVVDHPMLLIDDEADNASINTSKDPLKATKINSLIRELLKLFKRNCYVGYTATPFANIFIDPDTEDDMIGDDLFPRDFIVGLEPPDNYIGGREVFGDPPKHEDMVVPIRDYNSVLPLKHKNGHAVSELPQSLMEAVRVFVLAGAITMLRGRRNAHASMMVNVSRFVSVQGQLRVLVERYLDELKHAIRYNANKPVERALNNEHVASLHADFNRNYSQSGAAWPDLQATLARAAAPIRVVEVNASNRGNLDYEAHSEHGLRVIAIGGLSLSRGLTLEGLLVSYFLRNSQMYDTLMQMGRWFGYRPDYGDLCRVYMHDESIEWYEHIQSATEELHEEIRSMQANRQTPSDFGLRVRRHPDSLIVTARNKMQWSETRTQSISLQNKLVETYLLRKSDGEHNRLAIGKLVERLGSTNRSGTGEGNILWERAPAEYVLDFMKDFQMPAEKSRPQSYKTLIAGYTEELARRGSKEWDVVLVSIANNDKVAIGPHEVGLQVRHTAQKSGELSEQLFKVTAKNRVASRGLEQEGLTALQKAAARARARRRREEGRSGEVADADFRSQRERPLLMLHALELKIVNEAKPFESWVAAWGASFPHSGDPNESGVSYQVNMIFDRMISALSEEQDEWGDEDDDEDEESP